MAVHAALYLDMAYFASASELAACAWHHSTLPRSQDPDIANMIKISHWGLYTQNNSVGSSFINKARSRRLVEGMLHMFLLLARLCLAQLQARWGLQTRWACQEPKLPLRQRVISDCCA
jgi:hypothetical protein